MSIDQWKRSNHSIGNKTQTNHSWLEKGCAYNKLFEESSNIKKYNKNLKTLPIITHAYGGLKDL